MPFTPKGEQFTIEELQLAVGGEFYFIATALNDQVFVVNSKNNSEVLNYNINANYMYRRSVSDNKVLKGNVLLCNCSLLQEAHLKQFTDITQYFDCPHSAQALRFFTVLLPWVYFFPTLNANVLVFKLNISFVLYQRKLQRG
ncbi:hypothetical protein ACSX1A_11130 [Pontibacter sp. MBLB2868]|uniref:hypothetical protein n=1 Tax=Pontibacter sp. MBLB2868 TaxID=3451555 RepID=UPI003F7560C7